MNTRVTIELIRGQINTLKQLTKETKYNKGSTILDNFTKEQILENEKAYAYLQTIQNEVMHLQLDLEDLQDFLIQKKNGISTQVILFKKEK